MVAGLVLFGILQISSIGAIVHSSRQTHLFDVYRNQLAQGTAPVSEVDSRGRAIADGTPIATLYIPSLHLSEVVAEGTKGEVLIGGPGHLRDTPLPGEAGTSQIFGRQSAFGGPFGGIHRLRRGDTIKLRTGAGGFTYRVRDIRRPGDALPPRVAVGSGRVTLVTSEGTRFVPSGVLRVDADLVGNAYDPTAAHAAISASERALGVDTASLWALVLWLEGFIAVGVLAALAWKHMRHAQAWILFVPLALLVDYFVTDQIVRLLPNLL